MSAENVTDERQTRPAAPGGLRRVFHRLVRDRAAIVAAGFVVLLVLVAVAGERIAPHNPNTQNLDRAFAGPLSDGHILGTDDVGRDILSRLIVATRVAMLAAAQALGVSFALGVLPGLIAGYVGGIVDRLVMSVNDTIQAFPPLIFAIALVGVLGPGLTNAMLAVGVILAPTFLRVVRSAVLEVREATFIEASRSIGTPSSVILRRRVIPNILPPIIVQCSLTAGFALIAEAGLSFLGIGVQPPDASWGTMLKAGFGFLERQPWLVILPGAMLTVTVLAFNAIGDALRDAVGRNGG